MERDHQSVNETEELSLQFNLNSCLLDGLELPEVIILLSALLIGENYMHEYPFLKVIPCVVFAAGLMTSIIGILYFFKVAFRILQESKGDYRKKAKLQVYILVFIHAIETTLFYAIPSKSDCSSQNFCEMIFHFYNALLTGSVVLVTFKTCLLVKYPQLNAQKIN
ncbi:unnamed protein product [Larinioides sclopetarius]|uniref:Uncharacterized protein n=1 Tax=Larinioides sclopetarius TaxID=280406 RepID=A0AAV2B754_9ARAC